MRTLSYHQRKKLVYVGKIFLRINLTIAITINFYEEYPLFIQSGDGIDSLAILEQLLNA
jgi:hypothetical protein